MLSFSQLIGVLLALPTVAAFSVSGTASRITLHARTTTTLLATWSDSRAVKDYQDFLSSGKQKVERSRDLPSVILRAADGSHGALPFCLQEIGLGRDVVLTPFEDLPESLEGASEYPIYVTLPPYQLAEFLTNLPESYLARSDDFCFFSGGREYGNIEDVLKERGFCRDAMTQCALGGLAIAPNGRAMDRSVNLGLDANGESKYAGECAACGKWAGSVAERLQRSQVRCATYFYREWRRKMWERSFFDAIFPLLGVVRDQPTTVADVANFYEEEVADMAWDLSRLLRGWRAVTLLYGFEERLRGVAEMHGGDEQCSLPDDNMFPYTFGLNVFRESKEVTDYLWYAKTEKGELPSIELPNRANEDYTSKMIKGNLRADGVV
jgi:hypothetical protein